MSIATKHRLLFLLGLVSATAVEILAKGPWAHAVWAPTLIMLFTDFPKAVAPSPLPATGAEEKKEPPPPAA